MKLTNLESSIQDIVDSIKEKLADNVALGIRRIFFF